MKIRIVGMFILAISAAGCDSGNEVTPPIEVISSTVNGTMLVDGMTGVATSSDIAIVFSASLDPARLESELSLEQTSTVSPDYSIRYENAQSRIIISATLEFNTLYTLTITSNPIGKQNEALTVPLRINFTTLEDGTVYVQPPCTNTGDCLISKTLNEEVQPAGMSAYSSYPIYLDDAYWEKLKYAVIVIHGQNRDADNYFSIMTSTLGAIGMQDSTVLLAPHFKQSADTQDELYWPTTGSWREGQLSSSAAKISSFTVVDSLIQQLNDKSRFPVLEKIIVTGHSSGGLFTHLYGAANTMENEFSTTEFEYIAANSQYYYYSSGLRYDEENMQFYEPDNCLGYDLWPYGFSNTPAYMNGTSESDFNDQFVRRNITYFLGNGTGADGSLNTTDCDATLMGSTRYSRGENIYRFMNTFYPDEHTHQRTIAEGVGHDGARMYSSPEFKELLGDMLR